MFNNHIFELLIKLLKFYFILFYLFQCISELFSKLKAAEDASKPAFEKTANLQSEIEELKKQVNNSSELIFTLIYQKIKGNLPFTAFLSL